LGLLKAANERADEFTEATKKMEEERAELQRFLAECWEPLVAAQFPGREWRKRDKAVAQVAERLQALSAPESMVQSVCCVLKTRVASRGSFADRALEHGHSTFTEHIEALAAKIEATKEKAAELAKDVAEAEAGVQAAKGVQAERFDAAVAADNAWAQAESGVLEAREAIAGLSPKGDALAAEKDAAKTSLAVFSEVSATFAALRDGTAKAAEAAAAEASEAPVPEAPPAEAEG